MYNVGDLVTDTNFVGFIENIIEVQKEKLYSIFWFDEETIELQPFTYHKESEFTLLNV
jgi:hypothetical protein